MVLVVCGIEGMGVVSAGVGLVRVGLRGIE